MLLSRHSLPGSASPPALLCLSSVPHHKTFSLPNSVFFFFCDIPVYSNFIAFIQPLLSLSHTKPFPWLSLFQTDSVLIRPDQTLHTPPTPWPQAHNPASGSETRSGGLCVTSVCPCVRDVHVQLTQRSGEGPYLFRWACVSTHGWGRAIREGPVSRTELGARHTTTTTTS